MFTRHTKRAVIRVVGGRGDSRDCVVGKSSVIIGSADDCDLTVADATVSRRHLRVSWTGRSLSAQDLGSTNGSYAGQSRFERIELGMGAVIRIGQTLLKILPEEVALEPEAARNSALGSLVGGSLVMRKLFTMIEQLAATESKVLIVGETGTGKELVAEQLHALSPRRSGPFVVFDCAAVPRNLIEPLLLGHARGAFTGATTASAGLFAEAHGGTLFIDEIGELPIEAQPVLLRAVERGMVRKVGESHYDKVDVRVIAATHRNLPQMVRNGEFREDLYYRLSVFTLTVPPLRDRPDDIDGLVRNFLDRAGRPELILDQEVRQLLREFSWPGNVRELRNLVQRMAFHCDGPLATSDQLPVEIRGSMSRPKAPTLVSVAANEEAEEAEEEHTQPGPYGAAKAAAVAEFERGFLQRLVDEHQNLSAMARAAEMDRKHLRMLLRRYGLWAE
jgi:two-component system, NtrC family, nitrogen regulation response regulator GlnG